MKAFCRAFIVGRQTLFDRVVPQVSRTAHLSGVVIGFLTTLLSKHGFAHAARS